MNGNITMTIGNRDYQGIIRKGYESFIYGLKLRESQYYDAVYTKGVNASTDIEHIAKFCDSYWGLYIMDTYTIIYHDDDGSKTVTTYTPINGDEVPLTGDMLVFPLIPIDTTVTTEHIRTNRFNHVTLTCDGSSTVYELAKCCLLDHGLPADDYDLSRLFIRRDWLV